MRLIAVIFVFICGSLFAQSDEPNQETYKVARKFGYSDKREIYKLNRELRKTVKSESIAQDVLKSFERDTIAAAEYSDIALENLLSTADIVLRNTGHDRLADEIAMDFVMHYRNGFARLALGEKELGDHPPMSQWLDDIHQKIEDAIGKFFCEFFHIHDLYILNHGFRVVFAPSQYKLDDYKDHFSGHLIWGWFWEHHGVAGVVVYWVVNGICGAATSGMGIAVFACSPIATLAENVTDKRLAPPVAERIWKRANE
jgi:hypothetical protein